MTTTAEFLRATADTGSPVALSTGPVRTFGTGAVVRRIDGRRARTLDGLYRAFAAAWRFPEHFGANKDAFDDAIRDLDADLPTATGGRPRSFVTVVDHANALLADASDADFEWFAGSIDFYRDSYRETRGRSLGFALVLGCEAEHADSVIDRWRRAGVVVVRLEEASCE